MLDSRLEHNLHIFVNSVEFIAKVIDLAKLTPEQVIDVCKNYSDIYPVNFNCPGQITVSGISSQMTDFFADVKARK